MRVLVTGGTGYLGRAIVGALAAQGHTPIVLARRASAANVPVPTIDADVRDRRAVDAAVRQAEAVCHTAALVSLWRPRAQDFDDVNVEGLETVLSVCEARRVERIVYTSSFLALPPRGATRALEANDYQRTKVRAREAVRQARMRGVPVVALYPGVIYGPGMNTEGNLVGRLVRDHLAGRLPGIVGASRTWSYCYIDDVAAAHGRALEIGAAADLTLGGENAPQMRLFEIVRELTGRPLPRRIPFVVAEAVAAMHEARARLTGHPPLITRGAVAIFRRDWPLESVESGDRLGYRVTPLAEGVHRLLEAVRGLTLV